ncbi:MAG: DUF4097 domain-containing protein [Spirochaetaceae bacterium]
MTQVKFIKILLIAAVVSLTMVGLISWIGNIPSYFNGEKSITNLSSKYAYSVDEEMKYNSEGIDMIDIDLTFTNIRIEATDSNTISFNYSGTLNIKPKPDNKILEFELVNDRIIVTTTVRGKYSISQDNSLLTVKIPRKVISTLSVSTSSGEINVLDIEIEHITLISSSGDIITNRINSDDFIVKSSSGDSKHEIIKSVKYSVQASSGDINLNDIVADDSNIRTSSGEIQVTNMKNSSANFSSTSGDIDIKGYTGNLITDSSSGAVNIEFNKVLSNVGITTSSGDVKLYIPEDSSFKLNVNTSSGDIESALPITISGSYRDNRLVGTVGDGNGNFSVVTSSGDIKIFKK